MRNVTGNVAASVPEFLTRPFGVIVVPESTVPVGAPIAVTPTLVTRTVTVPDRVSLVWSWSPVRAVVQRVAWVPRCSAVQEVNDTNTESPGARLVTVWELS